MSPLESWLFIVAVWFLAIHLVLVCLNYTFRRNARMDRMSADWLRRQRRER